MQGSFRLGDWFVQPATGRLTRDGRTVRVRAKVMDLLVFLAQHPGEVLSKDALLDGVWGTEALSESVLTRSMTELRQSLDDDAEQPRVIETIPKRGYRVIAPVGPVTSEGPSATDGRPEDRQFPPRWNGNSVEVPARDVTFGSAPTAGRVSRSTSRHVLWALVWVAVGAAAGGAAGSLLALRVPGDVPQLSKYYLQPPDGFTYGAVPSEPQPAISPDGRHIAVVATARDATRMIWVHSRDSLSPRPLIGTEGAGFPFWSPDGRWIGFFAGGKLKKIRAAGGPAETICDAAGGFGASWGGDGRVVFAPDRASGLFSVPASGGEPVPLTTLDTSRQETSHWFPHILPDGEHYIYLVRSARPEHRGIYLGSRRSAVRKRLTAADSHATFTAPGYLLYVREAALMARRFDLDRMELVGDAIPIAEDLTPGPSVRLAPFSASTAVLTYRPGGMVNTELVWTDRQGKPLHTVGAAGRYLTPALSADGARLAVDLLDHQAGTVDTWLLDMPRGVPRRFTFGPGVNGYPVWSRDGSRIFFASNREGTWRLHGESVTEDSLEAPPDATDDLVLLESTNEVLPQSVSPDGQSLIYVQRSDSTGFDVWLLPLSGAREPGPLLQTIFNETHPQLSPDGRWLAFTSDESGRLEVYVRPVATRGSKWRVSIDGGCQPRWRADGKELFYLHGRTIWSASIETLPSFRTGPPRALFDTRAGRTSGHDWDYAPSPDGQRFLFKELAFEASGAPLVVVLDWQAQLPR